MIYNVVFLYSSHRWLTCEVTSLVDECFFVVTFIYDFNSHLGCPDL